MVQLSYPWIAWTPFGASAQPARLSNLPASALPRDVDADTAKAAIEQVNKRLDAELALKTSTETRALALATQCTTLLTAVAGATLVELTAASRAPLIHAGFAGGMALLAAVLLAHRAARPSRDLYLPGRLPDEIWDDLIAPDMQSAEFTLRLIAGLQGAMVGNERAQSIRAKWLSRALTMVLVAPVLAVAGAAIPRLGTIQLLRSILAHLCLSC